MLPFVTGMPHHTNGAPSGSPVFSIAAAGALRGYAFRSLDAGGGARWDLEQVGGWDLCFYGGSESVSTLSYGI
jgi:hypothetical protein